MQNRSPIQLRADGEPPSPFPLFVAFAAQNAELCDYRLYPEEQALLSPRATAKRLREFTLGRAAAHLALQRLLAVEPGPVLAGERGEPLWPAGIVGAISHSHDLAVAAVARLTDCAGLGVDLQGPILADLHRIAPKICLPEELAWIHTLPGSFAERLRLLFSAKESFFKAWSSERLTFHDLSLRPGPSPQTLVARLQRSSTDAEWTIGWRTVGDFVLTYFALPPR